MASWRQYVDIGVGVSKHLETCVLLVREREEDIDTVSIKVDLDGLNIRQEKQIAPEKGTYNNIKVYVKEKYGFEVASLYIAQVKDRMGLEKRANYNIGEGKGVGRFSLRYLVFQCL